MVTITKFFVRLLIPLVLYVNLFAVNDGLKMAFSFLKLVSQRKPKNFLRTL